VVSGKTGNSMKFGFLAGPGAQQSGKKIGQETEHSRPIIVQDLWPGFQSDTLSYLYFTRKTLPVKLINQGSFRGFLDNEFHLLHGPGLGLAHDEPEIAELQLLPGPGQIPQLGNEKPGQGFIIPGGQFQVERFV
jgi:hypothetical protein